MIKKKLASSLEALAARSGGDKWSPPDIFDLTDTGHQLKLEEAIMDGRILTAHDNIYDIADGLFEFHHPDQINSNKAREEFIRDEIFKGYDYGRWVLFPWSSELVRYPEPDDYRWLKTFRYRDLITEKEQRTLNMARIAIFGMSVGGNIAQAVAQNGIGEAIALGDMDYPDISNMGRANFTVKDLGVSKLDAVAKEISEIDPFIEQVHFREGVNQGNLSELVEFRPSLIGDEVDDMQASALLRVFSKDNRLPYVTASDVHDDVVVEVCRHDIPGGAPTFASRFVKDRVAHSLIQGGISEADQQKVFINSIGFTRLTPELIESGLDIGKRLAGIPQLGSTATAAAGVTASVYRDILLDRPVKTGIYSKNTSISRSGPRLASWLRALTRYYRG